MTTEPGRPVASQATGLGLLSRDFKCSPFDGRVAMTRAVPVSDSPSLSHS